MNKVISDILLTLCILAINVLQYNMKHSILRMKGRYIPVLLNFYVFATGTGICWEVHELTGVD